LKAPVAAHLDPVPIRLGLRANWRQFALLMVINAFVGAMVGLERTVVPLIAATEFGLVSRSAILAFLISFGAVKALANLFAGSMSDRFGRKRILVAGWLAGLPVPLLIILAPSWSWIIFANVLLGINQGLCWSTTVVMKIDLVGSRRRGLALGLNEFAGYMAVSLSALLTGYLAATFGLRPAPFYPGLVFAILGLLLSLFLVRETHAHARYEATLAEHSPEIPAHRRRQSSEGIEERPNKHAALSLAQILLVTSWKNRALFGSSQAGLVNNLNDGVVWGLAPILLAGSGLPLEQIGVIAAVYPGVWSLGQLITGALSDRWGRKWMIAIGMWVQAVGIGVFVIARSFWPWLGGAALLGAGTALVYPTLLAVVSDVAHPEWRASAMGVYRLWRDSGYVVGALAAGLLADLFGIAWAIAVVGGLTLLSGGVVAAVMPETLRAEGWKRWKERKSGE
jgi:MFS family permease